MGNKFTRISRRTFKTKKKKSKKYDEQTIKEFECQCSMFPITRTPTCLKCMAGYIQEAERNLSAYSGRWEIVENSNFPNCGAQFDAKEFDKIFELNTKPSPQIDESENDDSQIEDVLSDSFQSEPSEISKKHSEAVADDDNHSNHSYFSIFEVFEILEHDALLSSVALDEMFFYPAIGEATECDECSIKCDQSVKQIPIAMQISVEKSSSSSTTDEKQFDGANQINDRLFDENHLYDTVASSEESEIIIRKGSQSTRLSAQQLKSFKPEDLKLKEDPFYSILCNATQQKYIPFNATQFDSRQIKDKQFDGIIFNDSQFDAKYFDATEFDVTTFFVTLNEKSKINTSKIDSALKLNKIHSFRESQFNALEFDVTSQFKASNETKLNDELCGATEHQCKDAKAASITLNNERPEVRDFEAALTRTAQFVASHFGSEGLNDKHWSTKDFIAAPFRRTHFNASQFHAKHFDYESQFFFTQFDANFGATQFTASQFDTKAFDVKKCGHSKKRNRFQLSKLDKSEMFHDKCFNVTQFDAKLFNTTQKEVFAT